MTIDDLLKIELPSLREEILQVKKCQHRLFMFEMISTGAIIAFILPFISTILKEVHFWPTLFFLAPMIVVIPSQYFILDKAITINKICSFFKVIEERTNNQSPINIFGWETGCADFRRRISELSSSGTPNPTQGPNNFYKLIFTVTFIIAIILIMLMYLFYFLTLNNDGVSSAHLFIMIFFSFFILGCLGHQLLWLIRILEGKYTIMAMSRLWDQII